MIFPVSKGPSTPPTKLRRVSFSGSLTNLGSKLGRVLSNESSNSTLTAEEVKKEVQERSISRGREFQSSGRGGAGNIRRSSVSRDPQSPLDGPDDFSNTRGREMAITPSLTHSGRGGAGNIRSPSRDATTAMQPTPVERDAVVAATERDKDLPQSSGRGGFGNISRSRSRSRTVEERGRPVHSSGRGGAGNIGPGSVAQDVLETEERREYRPAQGVHSTGRGGIANLTASPAPRIDSAPPPHDPQQIHSSGRGGVGNIRAASRPRTSVERPDGDARPHSKDSERRGLGGMWDRVLSRERKE